MKVIKGNILKPLLYVNAICVPTNGFYKENGAAVMGAGLAKAISLFHPGIDMELGKRLKQHGNHVFLLDESKTPAILSFPTKNDWKENSCLDLINQSAEELYTITDLMEWNKVWLPAVGSGLGGRDWEKEVKPILESVLDDDRFEVVFR